MANKTYSVEELRKAVYGDKDDRENASGHGTEDPVQALRARVGTAGRRGGSVEATAAAAAAAAAAEPGTGPSAGNEGRPVRRGEKDDVSAVSRRKCAAASRTAAKRTGARGDEKESACGRDPVFVQDCA